MYTKENIEAFVFTSNRKDYLKDAVTSLLNQSIGDISITVMDVGSTDGTGDMIYEMSKSYPNLHYFWLEYTDEKVEVFKKAIEMTQKEFVIMFHDVDIMHPDYVEYAISAINKFPNTTIVSTHYQGWSNPTNDNWEKASKRFDYCSDKRMFANYLYRMQRYVFSPTVYKTQNLREHIFDMKYYGQFGGIGDKPFVANTMKDDDGAIIFRSKRLLRYRTYVGRNDIGPDYEQIIAFNKFFKQYMNESLYSKFMYNLINYKQLRTAYFWGHDFTLSLNEFIDKAISEDAGCYWTKLCTIPYLGVLFIETAHILRKFFKTTYKRVFSI